WPRRCDRAPRRNGASLTARGLCGPSVPGARRSGTTPVRKYLRQCSADVGDGVRLGDKRNEAGCERRIAISGRTECAHGQRRNGSHLLVRVRTEPASEVEAALVRHAEVAQDRVVRVVLDRRSRRLDAIDHYRVEPEELDEGAERLADVEVVVYDQDTPRRK